MSRRKFEVYKKETLKAGIRILDIYRGKDSEDVRFIYKGKVYRVHIKTFRENLSPSEFVELLKSSIK